MKCGSDESFDQDGSSVLVAESCDVLRPFQMEASRVKQLLDVDGLRLPDGLRGSRFRDGWEKRMGGERETRTSTKPGNH